MHLAARGLCTVALLVWATLAQTQPEAWYNVEDLNPGLGPPPEALDRSTPRTALRHFLEAAQTGDYETAAHLLNLTHLPRDEQAGRGPNLARKLSVVIDRRVWVDWLNLPGRPDAMIEDPSGKTPRAGTARRNLQIKLLEVEGRAYGIRISRYKAPGLDTAVWLFTPQTVRNIDVLYDAFGPRAFETYIPPDMKARVGNLRIWEWVALPVLLAFLFGLGWLTNKVVSLLARRARRLFLQKAFARAGVPLALVTTAFAAHVLLELGVSFSGAITNVLRPALTIVMVAGVGIAALRILDAILDHVTVRYVGEIDDTRSVDDRELYTSIYALRRVIVLLMVGFAVFLVLIRLDLFQSVGMTLLASAGVLTVLVGIAGQAVLGNIMASLQIALAKPVRIGDSVYFEGNWAYIESIFYTFLRLRTWDERRIVVPVKYFVSQPFENWSVQNAHLMKTIRLTLDHSADIRELQEVFEKAVRADKGVIQPDRAFAHVTDHSETGQEMTFYVMTPDPSTGWFAAMRLREHLLDHVRQTHPDWWPRERVDTPRNEAAAAATQE